MEKYLKQMIKILEANTFYTASGAILGLAALVVSLIALLR